MPVAATWKQLLAEGRLCRPARPGSPLRSPFQQDADLVVFSAAFRRLQDKTQVHPLSARGKVRTRLTHSIEVAAVGRSLGTGCGQRLAQSGVLTAAQADAVAHVVFAASLAHDIGNPPFGHGGEDALGDWFQAHPEALEGLSDVEQADLCRFEGNAQGLRTLTQLENYRGDGGLRLTYATLGAFMKYTVGVKEADRAAPTAAARKPGFFESERAHVEEVRAALGLEGSLRHPLAYLMEAADDICYAIIDVEDGHAMGLVSHAEAREALEAIAGCTADSQQDPVGQLQKLRGIGIGRLIGEVVDHFVEVEAGLRDGSAGRPLLDAVPSSAALEAAKALSVARVFRAEPVERLQREGRDALWKLLDVWVPAALQQAQPGPSPAAPAVTLAAVPGQRFEAGVGRAAALRHLVDCLSALTDAHVVSLAAGLA